MGPTDYAFVVLLPVDRDFAISHDAMRNASCKTSTCGSLISIRYVTQQVSSSDDARIVPYITQYLPSLLFNITKPSHSVGAADSIVMLTRHLHLALYVEDLPPLNREHGGSITVTISGKDIRMESRATR